MHGAPLHRRPDMTTVNPTQSKKAPATKAAAVCKLLARPRGATVVELMTATGWQNHSVRAFFTGLREARIPVSLREYLTLLEALVLVAAQHLQELELLGGFDAFGDDLEIERVAERDDRAHDRGVVIAGGHFADEGAVDLELVDREALQPALL